MTSRHYRKILSLALALGLCSFASAYDYWFSSGHIDLEAGYEGGALEMGVHAHDGDLELEADKVLFYAGQNCRTARPNSAAFDFIGVGAGQTYWLLPETESPDKLFLGIGLEELDPNDAAFAPYEPTDTRVAGMARWMTISLKGVSGPGAFSAWQDTDDGPKVWMSTNDGIGSSDLILGSFGSHTHVNYGFTAAGLYGIDLEASSWLDTNSNGSLDAGDTQLFSDRTTYNFSIESVPEPTTMLALGVGVISLAHRRKRKL